MERTEPLASPRPMIGVGAVVLDGNNHILLIRRDKPPAWGQWSLPGGCQEPGETLVETAIREVLEETAIQISVGPIIAVVERIREGFHYVIIDFIGYTADHDTTTPIPAGDVSDAQWVKLSTLNSYELVEGLRRVIDRATQMIINNSQRGLIPVDDRFSDFLPNPHC